MNPRCPECDIELDCSSDRWVCPLCRQTPRPEQYIKVTIPPHIKTNPLALRDLATAAANLIADLVADDVSLAPRLGEAYRMAQDIAERADELAHVDSEDTDHP